MKLTQHKSTFLYASLLSMGLMIEACTDGQQISPLDAIPEDANAVVIINLPEVMEKSGNPELALAAILPQELTFISELYSESAEQLDFSNLTIFEAASGEKAAIISATDMESLREHLHASPYTAEKIDGYKLYSIAGGYAAIGHGLCIASNDIVTIRSASSEKKHPLISPDEGLRQWLDDTSTPIRGVANSSPIFGDKMEGSWLCSNISFSPTAIRYTLTTMMPDGTPGEIGKYTTDADIDTDVLRFIPDGCIFVVASGPQSNETKLFGLESFLEKFPVPTDLSDCNGTMAIYGRPAGRLTSATIFDPEKWNLAFIAQSPQQAAPPTETIRMGDNTLSIGYIDGYAFRSLNQEVSTNNNNSYTEDFTGARLVALIDIPVTDRNLIGALALPCGFFFKLKCTLDEIRCKLSVNLAPNSNLTILEALNETPYTSSLPIIPHLLFLR